MKLIGSSRIKQLFPEFPREPKDIDWCVNDPNIKGSKGVELLYNPVLFEHLKDNECDLHTLYTLKMSHLFWDLDWSKHSWDMVWLQNKGAILNESLFHKLYKFHEELHGKNKRSDLKMTSDDFFNNAVECPYDHDSLHILLNNPPTYIKVLKDGAEVEVDGEKFNNLSFKDKCNLVYEEIELMSWERWPKLDYRRAYGRMFKKFIISHAPMFEAIFILQNFVLLSKYRRNHFKILENGNKIKRKDSIIKRSDRFVQEQV